MADLNGEGILCDFVRIEDESRISTAVVDPATNVVTEINEQGPEIQPDELELMLREAGLPGQGGRHRGAWPAACPAGWTTTATPS